MLLINTQARQGKRYGYAVFRGNGFDIPLTLIGPFLPADVMAQCENPLGPHCVSAAFVPLSTNIQGRIPYIPSSAGQKSGTLSPVTHDLAPKYRAENHALLLSLP